MFHVELTQATQKKIHAKGMESYMEDTDKVEKKEMAVKLFNEEAHVMAADQSTMDNVMGVWHEITGSNIMSREA